MNKFNKYCKMWYILLFVLILSCIGNNIHKMNKETPQLSNIKLSKKIINDTEDEGSKSNWIHFKTKSCPKKANCCDLVAALLCCKNVYGLQHKQENCFDEVKLNGCDLFCGICYCLCCCNTFYKNIDMHALTVSPFVI